ncbi:MAG: class I SAM-dependent methyltransferase [Candidatus Daviesbacteria bacterium]|nr:MAG: class I SAM-dependent methyltransferase [Candidatus Daviesbacteria bacterium]
MNCFICNQAADLYCTVGDKEISQCKNCGLGITGDLFSQVGDYHRDETYINEPELFKNIFQKRVKIISDFKKSGKVLEIGCSIGVMLQLLQDRGFTVYGVEMSAGAAKIAAGKGLKVIVDKFENIKFKDNFDIIILNHTLEHLENPRRIIKKCFSLLNKGGIIYIDVPNFGSWSARKQGYRWSLLLPEEHLWHFTYFSLEILLREFKFKIIYSERASGIFDLDNPFKELIFALIHFKKRFFSELVTLFPSLIISKLNLGTDLMIIAQK